MARHYSKNELLQMMKSVRKNEQIGKSAALCGWSVYANLFAYHFYLNCQWDGEKINEWLSKQVEYYNLFDEDPNQWFIQKEAVEEFANSPELKWYDDVTFTEPANPSKNKAVNYMNMRNTVVNNIYMEQSFRFVMSAYRALIDIVGTSEEFMEYYKGLEDTRAKYYGSQETEISWIHKVLVEEAGINIEMPTNKAFDMCVRS